MPLFPGLCVYTECLALYLPACERQACLCPGPLCSILPSCPKEADLLGARTRLFFVCRASHCLFLKATSDHSCLLKGHLDWGMRVIAS